MRKFDLSGEWELCRAGSKKGVPAQVPGCVHLDLLNAAELPDLAYGMNLERAQEQNSCDWRYGKIFNSEDVSQFSSVVLHFDGLHGCAIVMLNGKELGRVTNLFEVCEFEVKPFLKPLKNKLEVAFLANDEKKTKKKACLEVRRPSVEQGGGKRPNLPTVGIWREVSLLAFSQVRVTDLRIRQDFSTTGVVKLSVEVCSHRYDPDMHLEILVRVCYKGNILHEARDILNKDVLTLNLTIKNPQLWWPAGLGDQPLYEVTVDVLAGRTSHAHVSRRIGLRHFTLEKGGEPFERLLVNGSPLYLKGASWVPADLLVSRLTRVEYARLVKAATVANMNCLRVWGGGFYESDAFYDLCDEYGICVWQDLMLCDDSPDALSSEACASLEREIHANVCRLRHHACLALWCGGDAGTSGISDAYTQRTEPLVRDLDPDTPYLQPIAHQPFSLMPSNGYESLPSYPEPHVVAGYLGEGERNVGHPVCAYHATPQDSALRIYKGFLNHFLIPSAFDHVLWLSQIQQAVVLRRLYEEARMAERAPAGFLFWHFNECWPCCSSSALDSLGRLKAVQYLARRFFATYSLCGNYKQDNEVVDLHLFHDGMRPVFKGEVQWRISQMDGLVALEGAKKVTLAPTSHEIVASVKVGDCLKKGGAENLLMWIYLLDEHGNQVAWNTVLFCEPNRLKLLPPRMKAEIRAWDDNSFAVTLTSHHPAVWVWVSLEGVEARFDENFFSLEPDKSFRVRVTPVTRIKLDQFRQVLRIGSLRDTWQEKRTLMQVMAAARKK